MILLAARLVPRYFPPRNDRIWSRNRTALAIEVFAQAMAISADPADDAAPFAGLYAVRWARPSRPRTRIGL